MLAAAAYSAVATFALLKVIALVSPLKADRREEGLGMDVSQHGEEAYADHDGAMLILEPVKKLAAGEPALAEGGAR